MASEKNKKHSKKEEKEDIKPKTSQAEESEFIASTMDLIKEREKHKEKEEVKEKLVKKKEPAEKKELGKKETAEKKEEKPKDDLIKPIHEVEDDIHKAYTIRKIIRPSTPYKGIKKTAELFTHGWHYFVDLEEKITQDFFFGWLPRKIKKYLKLIIPFLLLFIILNLRLGMDPQIKKALALFVCISLLWALESINMIVTALMIPVLAVILGLIKDTNPFVSFSNPIIYLLLSGLILAQAFRKHELDKMLAVRVIALSKGKVRRLLFFTMLVTALLGMWMSNTATIALFVPVIMSISAEVNHQTEKNHTAMLLLAAGFGAAIGGTTTILGSNPNAITAAFLRNASNFGFSDWVAVGFPVSVILFVVAYFVFLKIYDVGQERINIASVLEEARQKRLNYTQKKILVIFFPTIFFWVFGSKLQGILNFPIDFYRTEIVGLTAVIMLFAFGILEWEDVRRIPWEIFLLVGGGLTLGQILIDTGSAHFLANKLFVVLSFLPTWMTILIIVALAIVLANFVNNSSTTIILVPVLMDLSPLLGINQWLLAMSAALATAVAPLTPIAMPSFSIIYGTGKVSRKEMVQTGLYIAMICGPVLAGILYVLNMLY